MYTVWCTAIRECKFKKPDFIRQNTGFLARSRFRYKITLQKSKFECAVKSFIYDFEITLIVLKEFFGLFLVRFLPIFCVMWKLNYLVLSKLCSSCYGLCPRKRSLLVLYRWLLLWRRLWKWEFRFREFRFLPDLGFSKVSNRTSNKKFCQNVLSFLNSAGTVFFDILINLWKCYSAILQII